LKFCKIYRTGPNLFTNLLSAGHMWSDDQEHSDALFKCEMELLWSNSRHRLMLLVPTAHKLKLM
jgi:hypothetical protein